MDIILEGIKDAIEDEISAQKKYKVLKEETDDDKLKALFEQLIKDEKEHEKILKSRYKAVKKIRENE
ncbi:MAG: ferritin family protein [Halanaerobacter sp.]